MILMAGQTKWQRIANYSSGRTISENKVKRKTKNSFVHISWTEAWKSQSWPQGRSVHFNVKCLRAAEKNSLVYIYIYISYLSVVRKGLTLVHRQFLFNKHPYSRVSLCSQHTHHCINLALCSQHTLHSINLALCSQHTLHCINLTLCSQHTLHCINLALCSQHTLHCINLALCSQHTLHSISLALCSQHTLHSISLALCSQHTLHCTNLSPF